VSLVYLFRKLVFIQVMLGIVAFCMAEPGGNPGLMLVAGTICALSWYVVEGPTGKPLPQWAINIAALAAVGGLGLDMVIQRGNVIIAMGHFTMWLQILQLYGKKTNREYGLILVLSLLQMVGASILSITMIFGILLGAYCILSLFTILLFQLKSTSDEVLEANQAASPRPEEALRPKAVVGRGHRWQFRLMATVIGFVCGLAALVIFILIPRTSRMSDIALSSALARAQTGFSPRVQLGGSPPGEGSREPVLNLRIERAQSHYLLRGAPLDVYNKKTNTWFRGSDIKTHDKPGLAKAGVDITESIPNTTTLTAELTLRSARHTTLFTLYPTFHLECAALDHINYNRFDQQVTTDTPGTGVLVYRIQHAPNLEQRLPAGNPPPSSRRMYRDIESVHAEGYARGWDVERDLIRSYALEALRAATGDATLDRDSSVANDPRDLAFARALERHLHTAFTYSTTHRPSNTRDPIVEFLSVDRQGHCELFASALAAMARSLGMRARVVTGYLASEYNGIGGYYIVRERNAHAWVEIDCGEQGWQVFDGTPPADIQREHAVDRSILSTLRELYEHLEFMWLDTFVTYDKETRDEMLTGIGDSIRKTTGDKSSVLGSLLAAIAELPELWRLNRVNFLLMVVILIFIILGVSSLIRTVLIRRRRLAALQLTRLPRAERRTLARRLSFYLHMLDLLERHGQVRPVWQSPFKFATDLQTASPQRYAPVVALTEEFYEIRFGHRDLDDPRQSRIKALLKQLEQTLLGRTQV